MRSGIKTGTGGSFSATHNELIVSDAGTGNGVVVHEGFEALKVRHVIPGSMNLDGPGEASIVLGTGNGSIRIEAWTKTSAQSPS